MTEQKQQSLMLVDGMALLFRAYFATASSGYIRRTKDGLPTNAIYGFIRYFWDAVQTFDPSHVVCCWDMGGQTFRGQEFAAYKGNRADAPDELVPQFALIQEVMDSLGIPNIGAAGYEADDCIGTLSRYYSQEMDVMILSGDHDLLQLVNDRTRVIIMKKGHGNYMVYTPQSLYEEKGLRPEQIIDVKGLMGDASDNYPGVRGIGEKTAMKLVQQYGSVEGILAHLDELTASVRSKIENDLDMLHLSRKLAEIKCDVPVACSLDSCLLTLDHGQVASKFEELEMKSLCSWMGLAIV
ncbi:5'-3' exonuclease H3TH domain-containing protein [Paenibacillus sp. JX-17]|uniref:5'-3' exonuclease n=1 Tax=Paenibacillus lacisoli TaxID=3064525 RepID=A0ABT9CFG5_9BACL|nr:5'-3' exonuclease H3TH domain-containing protein [Paenibacillus sp. JX-17]MDO7907389.1 5'-3' exonuclease H3TH domain-containing protein [Paenibacillus sp. JX-17]